MTLVALVPFKPGGRRKSRLEPLLDADARDRLALVMLAHVGHVLASHGAFADLLLLASDPPPAWPGRVIADPGSGLNHALTRAADGCGEAPLVVLLADLPLLDGADVAALVEAGKTRPAIAPDRIGTGTNALAFPTAAVARFSFGRGSFRRHQLLLPDAVCVNRAGLALDVDTPIDLALAKAGGFVF